MSNTRELSQLASVISVSDETRNVGIGTTNPISKLHVVGDGNFTGVVTASSFSGNASSATYADNAGIATFATNAGVSTSVIGGIGSITQLSVSGITTTGTLNVGTGGTVITTTSGGLVGINTTNPLSTLDVRGTISIGITDHSTVNTISSITDINSWEYGGISLAVGGQDTSPQDIYFKDDGTKMFILGSSGDDVNEYALSTAWEVDTATFTTVFSVASQETTPLGLYFKPDGTRMYICGQTAISPAAADQVRSYTLSTPWSIASGVTYDSKAYTVSDTAPQGVYFKDDGLKMYVVGSTGDAVYEYSLSIEWELDSTITLLNTLLIGATNTLNLPLTLTGPTGIYFNASGTKMYITDSNRDVVARFDLSTPWDTTTTTFYDNLYVGFQELAPTGVFYQEDQYKAYIVGASADTVFQYNTEVPSLELASAGISTRSSVIINNEARLNNRLYVTGDTHISSNANIKGTLTVDSTALVSSTLTAAGAVTASTTTGAINFGTSQTTGTFILGGTSQTGAITLGRATTSQTTNIQAGVTASGNQKTINLGTGGASGSRTLITVGSATAGAISTVTIPSPTNLLIGAETSTGTASQRLQVTGGAYVSGSVGIGTTNATSKLHVVGDVNVSGIVTATTFVGALTGTATSTTNIPNLTGDITSANTATTLATVNSNVGTFGSGGAIPTITVNAKGLVTGVTTTTVTSGTTITDDTSTNASRFLTFTSATSGSISAANVSSTKLTFNPSSGNLGIGTTNPTSALFVVGNARVTGVITATDFNSTSDISLKDNIQTIVNPLDKIIKLNGVTFNWKENQKPSIGVIAQELEKVLPELVTQGDIKSVNYNGLIGVLIEAVKEQQKQIEELKDLVKDLTTPQ